MPMWNAIVDLLRHTLFVLAPVLHGGLGSAIFVVSLAVRVVLLPLTVRGAMRAREHQRALAGLAEPLATLKRRHADDPQTLMTATRALYREHDVGMFPKGTLLNAAVQFPIGAALYQAIRGGLGARQRFLWIADLSRSDAVLTLLVGILAGITTLTAASSSAPAAGGSAAEVSMTMMAVVSAIVTVTIVWKLAAGVGVYWAASSVVGIGQNLLVRRIVARTEAAR